MAAGTLTVRLAVLAMLTVVGAGGCTPRSQPAGAGTAAPRPTGAVESGEGVTPAPTASSRPTRPQATRTPGTPTTTAPQPSRTTTSPRPASGCAQGEQQREVETYLARLGGFGRIVVDGRQSPDDCLAIKKFQRRYGIQPAEGRAGPTTADVARRLAETDTGRCRTGSGTTFCINLTLQTVWVIRDGKVVAGPTVTRTGMAGYATPTGTYNINFRNIKEWSDPYEVWLPYWQRFIGGIGFHQTTTYLHNKPIGSHGCVNLLPVDAQRFWELGRVGSRVYVFGRRPGT